MQTQREVVVTIRDPTTVLSLRAMNPRNLNAHVERAITQSGNENIDSIKVLSSNQLRSGEDPSGRGTRSFKDFTAGTPSNRAIVARRTLAGT
jgi:hypothetical protein